MRISTLFSIASIEDRLAAVFLTTEFMAAAEVADEVEGLALQQMTADSGMIEVVFVDGTTREVAESFVTAVIGAFEAKSGIKSHPSNFVSASETSLAEGLAFLAAQRQAQQAQHAPVDRSKMN